MYFGRTLDGLSYFVTGIIKFTFYSIFCTSPKAVGRKIDRLPAFSTVDLSFVLQNSPRYACIMLFSDAHCFVSLFSKLREPFTFVDIEHIYHTLMNWRKIMQIKSEIILVLEKLPQKT